ncbi:MAG: transporter substrate-binding domain-containing protein [Idiomarina sp.]
MQRFVHFLILVFIFLPLFAFAQQQPIRAIVSASNGSPYAIFENRRLHGGIAKDILDTLAQRSFRDIDYLNLPRARVELWLESGQADIACFLNPDWVNKPEQLAWSAVLFMTEQVFIRRVDSAPITRVEDLNQLRIGTVRGFRYPELEPLFSSGQAVRDDAADLAANIERLREGRLDTVMSVDLHVDYFEVARNNPNFAIDKMWAAPSPTYCALSKHNATNYNELQQVLRDLVDTGAIKKIIAEYSKG